MLLLIIAAAGTILRCYNLSNISFWGDEIQSTTFAAKPLKELFRLITQTEASPPLDYLILHFVNLLGADSEFSFRIPALIFGAGSIFAIYYLAKELYGKDEGIISSFLLALSPLHILYSRDARMYSLLVFITILSSYALIKALKHHKAGYWAGYSLLLGLSFYTHYFTLFILLSHIAYIAFEMLYSFLRKDSFYEQKIKSTLQNVFISLSASFILFLPWAYFFISQKSNMPQFIIPLSLIERLADTFQTIFLWLSGGSLISELLMVVLLASGLYSLKENTNSACFLLITLLVPIFFVVIFLYLVNWIFQARYTIFLLIPFNIICAKGIMNFSELISKAPLFKALKSKESQLRKVFAVVIIIILSGALSEIISKSIFDQKEDWKAATSVVAKYYKGNDLLIGAPYWTLWCLERNNAMEPDGSNIEQDKHPSLIAIRLYGLKPTKNLEDMCEGKMVLLSSFPGWNTINVWKGKLKYVPLPITMPVQPEDKKDSENNKFTISSEEGNHGLNLTIKVIQNGNNHIFKSDKIPVNNTTNIYISGRTKSSKHRALPVLSLVFLNEYNEEINSVPVQPKALLTGDFTYWGWYRELIDTPENAYSMELRFSAKGKLSKKVKIEFRDMQVFCNYNSADREYSLQ